MKTLPCSNSFHFHRRPLFLALLALIGGLGAVQAEANWPNWLGPQGNRSTGPGDYPVQWDADTVLWKVPLPGKGSSTPIVWQERIYLTSPANGMDTVLAFDLSGKKLWERSLGPEIAGKHRALGSGANASPVTDGNGLFVYFKSGNFAALELDGRVRWQINLVERFGRDNLFWDQGTSPVLTKQHVIMTRMHEGDSWVAAFDPATGEMRWKVPRNYQVPKENDNGYTTPVVFQHEGKEALLIWGADHLTTHDAANGKQLWSCGNFNPENTGYWPPISTPVIVGEVAVVPVGRDDRAGQARVHGIRLGGRGDVTASHRVWKREDLGVFVPAPAEYRGRIYLLRHRGEVVCLNPANGKTLWVDAFPKSSASYYSSPLIAGGKLYAARDDGMVFVANVERNFELLAENKMGERIIASPVPVSNRILLRGDRHLFCVARLASPSPRD